MGSDGTQLSTRLRVKDMAAVALAGVHPRYRASCRSTWRVTPTTALGDSNSYVRASCWRSPRNVSKAWQSFTPVAIWDGSAVLIDENSAIARRRQRRRSPRSPGDADRRRLAA